MFGDTLHLWTQIVGKVRLGLMPMINHWWQVRRYVSARGLTTSLMPAGARGVDPQSIAWSNSARASAHQARRRSKRAIPPIEFHISMKFWSPASIRRSRN